MRDEIALETYLANSLAFDPGGIGKIWTGILIPAPDPCFLFWGSRMPSPQCTFSHADLVWKGAILAVLRPQVQQGPPRRRAAASRAPQTTALFRTVGQNRALREILVEQIVRSESKISHLLKTLSALRMGILIK